VAAGGVGLAVGTGTAGLSVGTGTAGLSVGTGAGGIGSTIGGGKPKGTRILAAIGAPSWVAGVKRHWRIAAIAAASKAGPALTPTLTSPTLPSGSTVTSSSTRCGSLRASSTG
jgi:hypothetical protein